MSLGSYALLAMLAIAVLIALCVSVRFSFLLLFTLSLLVRETSLSCLLAPIALLYAAMHSQAGPLRVRGDNRWLLLSTLGAFSAIAALLLSGGGRTVGCGYLLLVSLVGGSLLILQTPCTDPLSLWLSLLSLVTLILPYLSDIGLWYLPAFLPLLMLLGLSIHRIPRRKGLVRMLEQWEARQLPMDLEVYQRYSRLYTSFDFSIYAAYPDRPYPKWFEPMLLSSLDRIYRAYDASRPEDGSLQLWLFPDSIGSSQVVCIRDGDPAIEFDTPESPSLISSGIYPQLSAYSFREFVRYQRVYEELDELSRRECRRLHRRGFRRIRDAEGRWLYIGKPQTVLVGTLSGSIAAC